MRSNASGYRSTTQEEYNMVSVVTLIVIGLCIGWIVWMRRRRARVYTAPATPGGIPRETLALDAFAHGNSYLAEGKFDEAIAAFHQARELDPKCAHVADRLAEVERRQHAASATLPTNGPS
jgi:predicted negative regulator of RcsB-dependent stress response